MRGASFKYRSGAPYLRWLESTWCIVEVSDRVPAFECAYKAVIEGSLPSQASLSPVFGILGMGSLRSPGANVWALLRSREDDPGIFCGADCVLMRGVELDPPVLCVRWRKDGVRL